MTLVGLLNVLALLKSTAAKCGVSIFVENAWSLAVQTPRFVLWSHDVSLIVKPVGSVEIAGEMGSAVLKNSLKEASKTCRAKRQKLYVHQDLKIQTQVFLIWTLNYCE